MRIWLQLGLVLVACSLAYLFPTLPSRESGAQEKAQSLVDAYYGRGHAQVSVTVRTARGERNVVDTRLGERGFVVGSQDKRESCQGRYTNEHHAEKLELPHKVVVTQEQEWVEQTDVAVVLDCEPGPEITPLLQAGLGLDCHNGDQIQVVRCRR